jgi:hypothetical protein
MIGAVPPSTLSMVMNSRKTADWNIARPISFFTRFGFAITTYSPVINRTANAQ